MRTIEIKRPEKYMGVFYKGFFLKSTIGKAYQIHVPFLDPNNKSYFAKNPEEIPKLHIREKDEVVEDDFEELSEDYTDEEDLKIRNFENELRSKYLMS